MHQPNLPRELTYFASTVKAVPFLMTRLGRGNPYFTFSVRDVLNKRHAAIVANAGPTSSFSLRVPTGLPVIGGPSVPTTLQRENSNGVLCIRGQVATEELSSTAFKGCVDVVQRGAPDFVPPQVLSRGLLVNVTQDTVIRFLPPFLLEEKVCPAQ